MPSVQATLSVPAMPDPLADRRHRPLSGPSDDRGLPTTIAAVACGRQRTTSRPGPPPPPCEAPPWVLLPHHQARGRGLPGGAPALFFEGGDDRRRADS